MTYRTCQNVLLIGSFLVLIYNLFLPPVVENRLPLARLLSLGTPTVSAATVVKVWTFKDTGLYYCPESRFYGKVKPGAYMNQDDALERGYRPAARQECR
jgi:hypothetical protein